MIKVKDTFETCKKAWTKLKWHAPFGKALALVRNPNWVLNSTLNNVEHIYMVKPISFISS